MQLGPILPLAYFVASVVGKDGRRGVPHHLSVQLTSHRALLPCSCVEYGLSRKRPGANGPQMAGASLLKKNIQSVCTVNSGSLGSKCMGATGHSPEHASGIGAFSLMALATSVKPICSQTCWGRQPSYIFLSEPHTHRSWIEIETQSLTICGLQAHHEQQQLSIPQWSGPYAGSCQLTVSPHVFLTWISAASENSRRVHHGPPMQIFGNWWTLYVFGDHHRSIISVLSGQSLYISIVRINRFRWN